MFNLSFCVETEIEYALPNSMFHNLTTKYAWGSEVKNHTKNGVFFVVKSSTTTILLENVDHVCIDINTS